MEIDKEPTFRQCERTAEFVEAFEEPAIAAIEVSWVDLVLEFDYI